MLKNRSGKIKFVSLLLICTVVFGGCAKENTEKKLLDPKKYYGSLSYEKAANAVAKDINVSNTVKKSLWNMGGNDVRMGNMVSKLKSNEDVTIAFLGGTPTEALNTPKSERYSTKLVDFLSEKYKNDKISVVQAGLANTDSTVALLRAKKDVLDLNPDFIVLEFALDDAKNATSITMFEALLRKCLNGENDPGVLILLTSEQNINQDEQENQVETQMFELGKTYCVPVVGVSRSMAKESKEGALTWSEYADENGIPTNEGHSKIAEYLEYYFQCADVIFEAGFYTEQVSANSTMPSVENYEIVTLYNNLNFIPDSLGSFKQGNSDAVGFTDGWIHTGNQKSPMKLQFTGEDLFLLYKQDSDDMLGKLDIFIDGELVKSVDANVENSQKKVSSVVISGLDPEAEHEVLLQISEESDKDNFHILGIGTSGNLNGTFDPEEKKAEEEKIPYTERGIINQGNTWRLQQVFERAKNGEKITIGYLGGSITQGTGADSEENSYVGLVSKWWEDTFPNATFSFVNAGIGATTSQFACARVKEDLLVHNPDFVIVEFSVNDENSTETEDYYESLLRMILEDKNNPAVMIVNSVQYDSGYNVQELHNKIGMFYDLPIVSMKESIFYEIGKGRINASDISKDMLHPNNRGHEYMSEVITYFLSKIMTTNDTSIEEYQIPTTENELNGLSSMRHNNLNTSPSLDGFSKDTSIQNGITDIFKHGWTATQEGSTATFFVSGKTISLQYRKTNLMAAPKGVVIIDGDEDAPIEIDGNFQDGWGDYLYLQEIYQGEPGDHTVEIRLTESGKNDFYLVSIITTE